MDNVRGVFESAASSASSVDGLGTIRGIYDFMTERPEGKIHHTEENPFREGDLRYAGYAQRGALVIRNKLLATKRYLAFSSDVGEAGRPVLSARVVNMFYGLTGAYIVGDIAVEGYHKKVVERAPPRMVWDQVARTTTFQLFGSLLIPFIVIHSAVHGTQRLLPTLVRKEYERVHRWVPAFVGLSVIPLLPMTVDHPVEHFVDYAFNTYDPMQYIFGPKEPMSGSAGKLPKALEGEVFRTNSRSSAPREYNKDLAKQL